MRPEINSVTERGLQSAATLDTVQISLRRTVMGHVCCLLRTEVRAPLIESGSSYLCLSLAILFAPFAHAAPPWSPGKAPLMTRWASEVNPTNSHPEYPRPQMVRSDWLNLNGLWDYVLAPKLSNAPSSFEGQILVPFPIESALSGVMRQLDETNTLWYRRRVIIPAPWQGKHVRLHFGAVDWETSVSVNGKVCGQHRGGYDQFSFDITDQLRWNGEEEILVAVNDPTEGDQPRGKQSRKPEGIFYTT